MSGGILSRFRRKPASVSELIARSRADAASASASAAQPLAGGASRRAGSIALSVAVMLGIALAGAWGIARLNLAPHEVQASSRAGALPQPRADRTATAPPTIDVATPPEANPRAVGAASSEPPTVPIEALPPASEALEGAPAGAFRGNSVVELVSQGEPLRLRVLTRAEARAISNGRWGQGLQVIAAGAGNGLDVRNGDVIYDLCDRAGDQSAAEIMAVLAAPGAPACVTFVRVSQTTEPQPN